MGTFFECKPLVSNDINTYFTKIKTKGKGGFGEVYAAQVTEAGKAAIGSDLPDKVAVKAIEISDISQKSTAVLRNEISVLKNLRIPHSIKYYGCFENNLYLYLIMELIDGQELYDHIVNGDLSTKDKYVICLEIAKGIKEFHDVGLIHRDIKPENIMIVTNPVFRVVIIDYGFTCDISAPWDGCSGAMGSPSYYDDKIIKGDFNSMKSGDWWAFGQILSILLVNRILYNERAERYANLSERDLFIARIPTALSDVILWLTRTDIEQSRRPNAQTIIDALTDAIKRV